MFERTLLDFHQTMPATGLPIPTDVTASGTLNVTCAQPRGYGGGTGHACQISRVWLLANASSG